MGSGLFIGSGAALNTAGPGGAFVAYAIVSLVIYFTMASLGELATYLPIPGSFNAYGSRFVDPAFGFALSWNYWLNWLSTVANEAGAVAIPVSFWLPHVHFAVWGVSLIALVFVLNAITVRGYGEAEFWFALVKILAVCVFIIVAIAVAAGGLGGHKYGFEMWHYKEAPFVGGLGGLLNTFIQAGFSMQGSELVGVAAAESRNPAKHIPRATRQIVVRLAIFFVLTIFLMGLVIPYDDPRLINASSDASISSPFIILFEKAGIKSAAHIMNAVLVISSVSACSSGLYAACRTVHVMAMQGQAPQFLGRTTSRGVPLFSLVFCVVFTLFLWSFNFVGQGIVFVFLSGISGVAGYLAWASICVVHIRFRMAWKSQGRDLSELRYRAALYPFGPVFCFVLISVVIFGQAYPSFQHGFDAVTFFSSFVELPIFALFVVVWKWYKKTKYVALDDMDLDTGARGGITRDEESELLDDLKKTSFKDRVVHAVVHIFG
ncbi:amino acid transporter [Martensiomyces pterosporus]|nr:amino acid transporter [Martensiomyces pterosporus]